MNLKTIGIKKLTVVIYLFFMLLGVLFLTGCFDSSNTMEITFDNTEIYIKTHKPNSFTLDILGSGNNITIGSMVNVTSISFSYLTKNNVVRVSNGHVFSFSDNGHNNRVVRYGFKEENIGGI